MTVSNKGAKGEYGLSRRNFLQVAGAGAGAAMFGAGAGIAGASAADSVTINLLLCNMPWCEAFPTLINDAYKKETNGRVSITAELLPYESLYEKIVLELSSGSSTYDMFTSDCYWVRQWITNNWVFSFEEMKQKNPALPNVKVENLHPGNRIYTQYNGKTWGMPGNLSTPVFVWRKDLLEKAGIENPPKNWDEYLVAAKAMNRDGVAGAMLLPGGQDSCMGDFVARLMGYVEIKSPGDDFMLNDKNEVIFDRNDGAERAIERLKEILPYCPKGVMNFDYPEASSVMQSGAAAMLVCWIDVMPGFESSPFAGKFGYTTAPTDHYQQQIAAGFSLLGNTVSANPEEVYRFMSWMCEGKAYQLMREKGESTLVYLPDIENPQITSKIPMMKVYEDFKTHGTKTAALFPYRLTNADKVQRIMYEEVVKTLSGEKTTKAALESAKDRMGKAIKV